MFQLAYNAISPVTLLDLACVHCILCVKKFSIVNSLVGVFLNVVIDVSTICTICVSWTFDKERFAYHLAHGDPVFVSQTPTGCTSLLVCACKSVVWVGFCVTYTVSSVGSHLSNRFCHFDIDWVFDCPGRAGCPDSLLGSPSNGSKILLVVFQAVLDFRILICLD